MITEDKGPNKRALHNKRAFLAAYAVCGMIGESSNIVGIRRQKHSQWMREDPDYAVDFEEADQAYIEKLEKEADRRAVEGVEEPVYQGGQLVGTKLKYSDVLLIFRLKAKAPAKYRDRYEVVHTDDDLDRAIQNEVDRIVKERQTTIAPQTSGDGNGDKT